MPPRLPQRLRFLEDFLDVPHQGLAAHFPKTAAGQQAVGPHEEVFWAGDIGYLGRRDGSMVPVAAENLEPIQENIFTPEKFAALTDAIRQRLLPVVDPGYAHLSLEDGQLVAQIRDGHHRTLAAVAAGAAFSWVMMSDHDRQLLDESEGQPELERLYRAIRKAQRAHDAPEFKRKTRSRIKKNAPVLAELIAAERRWIEVEALIFTMLHRLFTIYGHPQTGYDIEDQLRRPHIFWNKRLGELLAEHGRDWLYETYGQSAEAQQLNALRDERSSLHVRLYDLRRAAGINPITEKLDPNTGTVVREHT